MLVDATKLLSTIYCSDDVLSARKPAYPSAVGFPDDESVLKNQANLCYEFQNCAYLNATLGLSISRALKAQVPISPVTPVATIVITSTTGRPETVNEPFEDSSTESPELFVDSSALHEDCGNASYFGDASAVGEAYGSPFSTVDSIFSESDAHTNHAFPLIPAEPPVDQAGFGCSDLSEFVRALASTELPVAAPVPEIDPTDLALFHLQQSYESALLVPSAVPSSVFAEDISFVPQVCASDALPLQYECRPVVQPGSPAATDLCLAFQSLAASPLFPCPSGIPTPDFDGHITFSAESPLFDDSGFGHSHLNSLQDTSPFPDVFPPFDSMTEMVASTTVSPSGSEKQSVVESGKNSVRKYVCEHPGCGRSFVRRFNLSTHMQTHLGMRKFRCPVCPKGFTRKHDLSRHLEAIHRTIGENDATS